MFDQSYGYAIFPTVGKAGFWVGGAYGKGRVYKLGEYVGDTSITQATVGLQIGAQGFAMIIFFQDKRAFNEFTSGNFEFNAQVSATAITAGVSAGATTTGTHSGASAGKNDATASGAFYRGMAVYTIARGGLMAEASVGGQKFTYTPR
ncbi:MAG: lipid-binding SYLF domain-containing protein [Pseudomonadales bacterium]|nr:lipid-binding SYLF domain-containing protein [Pseudomonadales bacterium]MDP6471075.1 lipid-binding SYLF domain-containing protein [Pseudomonadales bacterium]MDP6970710.1 lipid-binding SYLF domain-containing protein [Pseudomonadales bacterium]